MSAAVQGGVKLAAAVGGFVSAKALHRDHYHPNVAHERFRPVASHLRRAPQRTASAREQPTASNRSPSGHATSSLGSKRRMKIRTSFVVSRPRPSPSSLGVDRAAHSGRHRELNHVGLGIPRQLPGRSAVVVGHRRRSYRRFFAATAGRLPWALEAL